MPQAVCTPQAGATVAVAGALTSILEINSESIKTLFFRIVPTGADLTDFQVQARSHEDGAYTPIVSAAGDFTGYLGHVFDASGSLVTLTDASVGWMLLDNLCYQSLRIRANSGSSITVAYEYCVGYTSGR